MRLPIPSMARRDRQAPPSAVSAPRPVFVMVLLVATLVGPNAGWAQSDRATREFGFLVGSLFGEPSDETYLAVGASYSHHVYGRMRFRPEFIYLYDNDYDNGQGSTSHGFIALPNLAVDFRDPQKPFVPNSTIGMGAIHLRHRFVDRDSNGRTVTRRSTQTVAAPLIRFSFRFFVTDRVYLEPALGVLGFSAALMSIEAGYVPDRLPTAPTGK